MVSHLVTLAQSNSSNGGGGMVAMFMLLVQLAIMAVVIAGIWKVFTKAGHPGWAAIVPLYNLYIMTKIVGRPWWWMLLCFIPFLGIIPAIILMWDLARSFGKDALFTVGLVLLSPIFMCVLGFGRAQYQGPAAAGAAMPKLA
jgi:hypothetical protein